MSGNEEGIKKIAEGVYAFIGPNGDANHGFITTARGLVVIDNDIRSAREFQAGINAITRENVSYLINTHHAFDHTSANHLLAGAGTTIISSAPCRRLMVEMGDKLIEEIRGNDPRVGSYAGELPVTLPDLTFERSLSLHLGSHLLEITHFGQAHTPGDSIVYLPREGILFAGDLIVNGYHPQARDGNLDNWLKILDEMEKMPIRTIVPGHGFLLQGKEGIRQLRTYFLAIEQGVARMVKAGKSLEEIQKELALPAYQGWGKVKFLPNTIKMMHARVRKKDR